MVVRISCDNFIRVIEHLWSVPAVPVARQLASGTTPRPRKLTHTPV